MSYEAMQIGNYVNFQLYSNPALQNTFARAKVVGILDSKDAANYIDVHATHANIVGSLPGNPSKNADDLKYYKLLLTGNKYTAVAEVWINPTSVVLQDTQTYQYTLSLTPARANALQALLAANKFNEYSVVLVD